MEKLKCNNILICKIIKYSCNFNKLGENVLFNEDSSVESGIVFENKDNKNLCNISLVCWQWFKFVSKYFKNIGTFQKQENYTFKRTCYSPISDDNDPITHSSSSSSSSLGENIYQVNEENKKLLESGIIPFSKFKLLNLDNVQCITEQTESNNLINLIDILKNFKNLNKIRVSYYIEFSSNNDSSRSSSRSRSSSSSSSSSNSQKSTIDKLLNTFKNYNNSNNLSLVLDLFFSDTPPTNKGNNQSLSLSLSSFDGIKIDTVKIMNSNNDSNEMELQLKLIQLLNPKNLIFTNYDTPYSDWKSAHHKFNKEFFQQCNRMKSFEFVNDFLDLQNLNFAIENGIECINTTLLFHDLFYHLVDPTFKNR